MEPILLSTNNWPAGIVSLHFGSTLYVDASTLNLRYPAINLIKQLGQHMLSPNNQVPISNYLAPDRHIGPVPNRHRVRSNSLDSGAPIYIGNVRRTIQLCMLLHRKFMDKNFHSKNSHSKNFQTKNQNIGPKNTLGRARWNSTGQISQINI